MKKLLLLGVCLLALMVNPMRAYASDPDIMVVRVQDNGGNVRCTINGPNGWSELIEFNGGISEKGLKDSGQGYYKMIAKLYQEGYVLKNSFSNPAFTTLVFEKAK